MPNKLTEAEIQKLIPLIEQTKWHYRLDKFTDESLGLINRSVNQARREVASKLATINPKSEFTKQRLEALSQELQDMTVAIQHKITGQINGVVSEVASKAYPKNADILSFGGLVPNFNNVQLTATQLKSIVDTPVGGKLMSDWVETAFTANLKNKFQEDIATGMLKGESYKNLVKRFKTDAFTGIERDMEGLVRTQVQSINTNAMKDTMQANADIMKGWKWNSVYENRTCIRCMSMDAKDEIYPIMGGPQIPLHINCRCFPEPITKTFRELGVDIDEIKDSYRPYTIRGKVDPVTGRVIPGKIGVGGGRIIDTGRFLGTYDDFFKQLPENVQMQMLGPTRFGMLKEGKLKLSGLADKNGNAFLIKELEGGKAAKVLTTEVVSDVAQVAKFTLPSAEDLGSELYRATSKKFDDMMRVAEPNLDPTDLKRYGESALKKRMAALSEADQADYLEFAQEFFGNPPSRVERKLVEKWASTSGDKDTLATFMQMMAKEEFDLSDTVVDHLVVPRELSQLGHALKDEKIKNGARKFLREMYNETQEQLAKQGVKELTLFRGVKIAEYTGFTELQPLSSFSASITTARDFTGGPDKGLQTILSTKVPANKILSLPSSGYGCFNEQEFVVLGEKINMLKITTKDLKNVVKGTSFHDLETGELLENLIEKSKK